MDRISIARDVDERLQLMEQVYIKLEPIQQIGII
jgi:hypothetical protein